MPRIRERVFPNPRRTVPSALAQQAAPASRGAEPGNPGTIRAQASPEGKKMLEWSGAFSDPAPRPLPKKKREDSKRVQRESVREGERGREREREGEGSRDEVYVCKGLHFRKPVFIAKPARCHVNLIRPPTKVK